VILQFNSAWDTLGIRRASTHKLARRGEELLAYLKRHVRLPPGNRIQLAIRTIDQLNAHRIVPTPGDTAVLETTTAALRTLWDAFFIVHAAVERRHQPYLFPAAELRYLLKGATIGRDESNREARNHQCEMFVAALLATGGAHLQRGEPDFRLLYHGEYVGVAVKRMKSAEPEALLRELRDGATQIASQNLRGFVAFDLDEYLDSLTLETLPEAVGASFNENIAAAHDALRTCGDRTAVIGVLLFGTRVAWVFDSEKPLIRWVNPLQWLGFSEVEPEERLREFFDVYFKPRLKAGFERINALVA
jgi:hypothetical protein